MVFKASKWYRRPLCCGNTVAVSFTWWTSPQGSLSCLGREPWDQVWIWQDKRARSDDESVDKVVYSPKHFFFLLRVLTEVVHVLIFWILTIFIIPHLIQIYLLVKNVWKQHLFLSIFLFYELLENWKFYTGKIGLVSRVKRGEKEKLFVVGRIRTCAGRPQWISSPSP